MHSAVSTPAVVWLGEATCGDCRVLGGKAGTLCRLAAEYPVPPGFCVTAAAWAEARAGAGLNGAVLPPWLAPEVQAAYARLAEVAGIAAPSVAVRSSALDEDGAGTSFAGQHESYLNVIGPEAVVRAVAACWASARSDRALAYRRRHGLPAQSPVAVLVQLLVPADVSAVVFSANPVTGARDEIVINASWGLGESIVGGTVTPDTYILRKTGPAVRSRTLAEKRRMTVPAGDGTHEVEVPRFLRTRAALTDAQAAEMAALALSLERRMGGPVDVECAVHGGQLYLLQCRPITTLAADPRAHRDTGTWRTGAPARRTPAPAWPEPAAAAGASPAYCG